MGSPEKMKIGVLTSSRADYGIYLPLLQRLKENANFDTDVIAFGAHLSDKFGHTVDTIYKDGFKIVEIANTLKNGDLPEDISLNMAGTLKEFSSFYAKTNYQLLFALGDRYEMFSAVAASVPFNIPIAHIHGGETTLGAIDNAFRHSITCFSKFHFTSTEIYRNRVAEIIGGTDHVYNVGALSIDSIKWLKLLEIPEFRNQFGVDLSKPTILFTFHPETVNYQNNKFHIAEILKALKKLDYYQKIVTMPNADTMGIMIRDELLKAKARMSNIYIFETLGSLGYLSAMKHCSFMLGNSSSGFVEAAYFSKPVINLGERQKGRILTSNIQTIPITTDTIFEAVKRVEESEIFDVEHIYGTGVTSSQIINIIKKHFKVN